MMGILWTKRRHRQAAQESWHAPVVLFLQLPLAPFACVWFKFMLNQRPKSLPVFHNIVALHLLPDIPVGILVICRYILYCENKN